MGSILGSILGAVFMTMVPEVLKIGVGVMSPFLTDAVALLSPVRTIVFGALIIGFLIFERTGSRDLAAHPPLLPSVAVQDLNPIGSVAPARPSEIRIPNNQKNASEEPMNITRRTASP